MTIVLDDLLPCILYVALIIFVIILTLLIIRLMKTLKKVDNILLDVDQKMKKVDGVFDLIDRNTDFANSMSDKIVNGISQFVNKIFKKKRGKIDE